MSLMGSMRDPFSFSFSVFPGGLEFDWFEDLQEAIEWGVDQWGTGPIPMPAPRVPDVISEIPQTMEELVLEQERLEEIINEQPFIPQGPINEEVWGPIIRTEVTPEQDDVEEPEMAHDWGHLAREFIGGIATDWLSPDPIPINQMGPVIGPGSTANQMATQAAMGNGNGCDGMTWSGGAPPKGYKVVRDSCGNGVLRKVRRRRRRRMLTQGDKSDIASIVSMVGKGQLASSLINRSTS